STTTPESPSTTQSGHGLPYRHAHAAPPVASTAAPANATPTGTVSRAFLPLPIASPYARALPNSSASATPTSQIAIIGEPPNPVASQPCGGCIGTAGWDVRGEGGRGTLGMGGDQRPLPAKSGRRSYSERLEASFGEPVVRSPMLSWSFGG